MSNWFFLKTGFWIYSLLPPSLLLPPKKLAWSYKLSPEITTQLASLYSIHPPQSPWDTFSRMQIWLCHSLPLNLWRTPYHPEDKNRVFLLLYQSSETCPPSPFSKPYLSQHSLLQPPNTYNPMKLSYMGVLFPSSPNLRWVPFPGGRLTHLSNCSIKIPPM